MEDSPAPIAEIDHGPSKLDQFLEKNQKKLIIIALAIFLGVIAYILINGISKMNEEKAGTQFLAAATEDDYKKVITDFPSEVSAGSAAYRIASMRTNNDDAVEALSHFISNYPDHPLVPMAEFNLASRYANQNNSKEAITLLENIIDAENTSFLTPKANILLGDIALSASEKEKAENYYKKALEYNDSEHSYAGEARTKIAFISASAPKSEEAPKDEQPQQPSLSSPTPVTP